MVDCTFKGPFAAYIKDHIKLKQSIGYKYLTEANHLLRFSAFTADKYPNAVELTKVIVLDWCSKKTYESQANQCSRASIIRQLSIYMDSTGINTYILPKAYFPKEEKYIPYVYTEYELNRFFHETDKCHYVSGCPHRNLIMPIFFRMVYSCGLRSSEARLLKVQDVDLELGLLTIEHSKKDKSRLVPMSDEITKRCTDYFKHVHMISKGEDYFFPGLNGKPMTLSNIYHNFRRFLWKSGISHGGRGKGPRVHDFRHTFACHCLKKWVMEGKDLSVYLPILMTYMGHDSFEETAYYLKMTADVFPNISITLERCYSDIIPELEGDKHEAY